MTPENELIIEVPESAKDFVIDMGYLIFKVIDYDDPKKWVTDAEIERDVVRFLTTGKSKFNNTEPQSMYITTGIKLPDGNYSIVQRNKTNIVLKLIGTTTL